MVKDQVDVIVAFGTEATRAARRATSTMPIVMAGVGDPIRAGFITSLSRPGGNTTGVSLLNQELWPKRLELIKEVAPGATRVAIVSTSDPQHTASLKLLLGGAPRFGLELRNVLVSRHGDLDQIFTDIGRGRADAILVQPSPMVHVEHTPYARSRDRGSKSLAVRLQPRYRRVTSYVPMQSGQPPAIPYPPVTAVRAAGRQCQ